MTPPVPDSLIALRRHRRVLLLQGPMGPFFRLLAEHLEAHGAAVGKIHLNGGDEWFWGRPGAMRFRGTLAQWPAWLSNQLGARNIDALVLFGQARPAHAAAIEIARACAIAHYVFEEGYLRPDFVTLEAGGVNARSSMPRQPDAYRDAPMATVAPLPAGQTMARMAWIAARYALAATLARPLFGPLPHHRPLQPLHEALCWARAGWRKLVHGWRQRHRLETLCSPHQSRRWFLFPLQVSGDSQITHHSPFASMEAAIEAVLASFAQHAPPDTQLVVKHHPMDRGHSDYTRLLAQRGHELGLAGRLHYVHDLHLPTLLRHTRGVVTVNSTAGLQALHHHAPVCVLGECFYALEGLVQQGGLDAFWQAPPRPDAPLFARFRALLQQRTQLNASFYARAPALTAIPPPRRRAAT